MKLKKSKANGVGFNILSNSYLFGLSTYLNLIMFGITACQTYINLSSVHS